VVTLSGQVHHRSTAHLLTRLVNRVEGVAGVESELTWQTDDLVHPYVGL
jgi:osmotically-inducible protein OsmY